MRRKLVALAAAGIVSGAPWAVAAEPVVANCHIVNVAEDTLTGSHDTFTGVAVGYVVGSTPGDAVSIRCFISVNGRVTDGTEASPGTSVASTVGRVTYTAGITDDVDLCAEWTDGRSAGTWCRDTVTVEVLPGVKIDPA